MTQQEQHRRPYDDDNGTVPGPRSADHDDDVVVGTAHAPNHEDPRDGEAEQAYPAATYASGSSDAPAHNDAEVVDRDDALADERAEDGRSAEEEDARADDPYAADARDLDDDFIEDARDTDAVYEDADRAHDTNTAGAHDTDADGVYDQGMVTTEGTASNRSDTDFGTDDASATAAGPFGAGRGAEDEREEEAAAEAEAAEDASWQSGHRVDGDEADRAWAAEHATQLRAGSVDVDREDDLDHADETRALDGVQDETRDEPADDVHDAARDDAAAAAAAGAGAAVAAGAGDRAEDDERRADDERAVDGQPAEVESAESRPGSVDVAAVGAVWADGAVDGLRERWRALQLRFIDDPRAVAGEADELVGEAVDTITNALQAQRRELAAWQDQGGDDTERLRAAVRGYRDYLDRLLGM
ncbi:hypothetical protein [Dactylosporangium sp. CA-139066]|uniref:hypothetical protein n=1 Tax=Dactylosporangium sp. CA-139066 TaxID=3239930 RepID=UPI003D9059D1